MNTKTYKQAFVVLAVSIFIVPQIAFAAWWNPLSWSVWNIFRPTPKVQQVQIATTTPATPTATREIKVTNVGTQTAGVEKPTCTISVSPTTITQGGTAVLSWKTTGVQPNSIAISSQEVVSKKLGGGVSGEHKMLDSSVVAPSVSTKYSLNAYIGPGTPELPCYATLTVIPNPQASQQTIQSAPTNTPPPNTTLCNGTNWTSCPAGQEFVCPAVGKATCVVDNSSQILDSLAKQLELLNEQQKQNEISRQQALQDMEQQFLAKYKPCDDWLKQIDANVVAVKAEISAAGGFGTASQVQAMAIQRSGNPPAQCGGFSSGYTSTYSSTHCNSLNGGLDCTSSGGARMQATPIPGGSGFNINSW